MLDRIDRELIELLRKDARLSYRELGERVFLSANSVAERVRRLIADHVLIGFSARVNLEALQLKIQALVDVKLGPSTSVSQFESVVVTMESVMEALLTTGNYDYTLRVACADQAALVQLIEALRDTAGVTNTHSRIILRQTEMNFSLFLQRPH